ncbi:ribosomal protein S18-alanine N-acetyltransferase [Celerinatantimonas sp. YJH-8]|uniref:ribosomal protein S18-alanine N-acetyltransferase n=1 Tax=Celerinatantimonas sp. YJH-8 TaxID=3228714 RepID=UPI0038C122C3
MFDCLDLKLDALDQMLPIEQQVQQHPWSEKLLRDSFASSSVNIGIWQAHQLCGYLLGQLIVDEAEIFNLSVAKAYQRQGLGKQLLEHFSRRIQMQGGCRLLLEVRESNVPALQLYSHYGFHEDARRRGYYPNGPQGREDAILMSYSL